jgi:hypothetical protein
VANLKPQNFLKTVLIGLAVLLVMALVSCGGSSSDETEPYVPKIGKAKIIAPEGSGARMVPAGMTKSDLDRVFNAYFEVHSSAMRSVGEREIIDKEKNEYWREMDNMAKSGRVTLLLLGTECRVVEADSRYSKVKILNGPRHQLGKTFWVPSVAVVNL